jgi:alkanesulfonate monooxygenase SsuD/methylene tetrahydromethanopterin reductase-like flavin-dependent oxidoreductase (luciferase family)/putative sterol carrier protein
MRFGLFYEHQLPRPWEEDAEANLLRDALEQVELADRLGFDHLWEVEHHFLEEYSHSSAPEVFLAAASQRTRRIRLGHGIVQLPPGYNHPARVAERIATLDLVSGGRVEFGTGESSSQMELGGFGVSREDKRAQWEEALDAITRMFVEEPFAGYDGRWIRMPPRNVVPKPFQKPHPPLWMACSRRDTIVLAARKGLGALSFSFVEPEDAKQWVDAYYSTLASSECVPAGFTVNPNVAVVVPFMCHQDEQTAIERGIDGGHFFGYSLAHYYVFGQHRPGHTRVYEEFERNRAAYGFARELIRAENAPLGVRLLQQELGSLRGAVGTPSQVADLCERYQAAGVDEVIFVSQAGRNRHEHICESLELFGKEVLPRFAEHAEDRDAAKAERLGAAVERALARRKPARTTDPAYLVTSQGEPSAAPSPVLAGTADAAASVEPAGVRDRLRSRGEEAFRRLLAGRSDRQIERIIGNRVVLQAIFRGVERSFHPDRADGFQGDIQYELSGERAAHRWVVRVHDGRAEARPGSAPAPAVTLRMSVPTFGRIVSQELQPGLALMEGKLGVEGDHTLAARIGYMFAPEA